jgi:hypothetical protein
VFEEPMIGNGVLYGSILVGGHRSASHHNDVLAPDCVQTIALECGFLFNDKSRLSLVH